MMKNGKNGNLMTGMNHGNINSCENIILTGVICSRSDPYQDL